MKFKISIYETKKYKASKKKVLEFSEFKDIVDVDKKYVPTPLTKKTEKIFCCSIRL